MFSRLLIMSLGGIALSSGAMAGCVDSEPYEVCILEAQRNNALNDLAHLAGQQDRQEKYWRAYLGGEEVQRQALTLWWQQYLAGEEEQRQQAARESATMAARAAEAARSHGR